MTPTLEAMAKARTYKRWLYDLSLPHVGRRVLEVGSGTGTMTELLTDRERLVALEIDPRYAAMLRSRYGDNPGVRVVEGSATDSGLFQRLRDERLDSAVSYNVFEHIDDDEAAFANVNQVLVPGSLFTCLVPASPSIYTKIDALLGHHRRYHRSELERKVRRAGFDIVSLHHMNLPGYFAWWVSGTLSRGTTFAGGSGAVAAYDRLVMPVIRAVESRWHPPFGQSLLLVARSTGP